MPLPKNEAWFHAKTYGWGWGPPIRWQGWVVLVGFIALTILGSWLVPPHKHPAEFVACIIGLSGALVLICWLKGEQPGWRWGDKDK